MYKSSWPQSDSISHNAGRIQFPVLGTVLRYSYISSISVIRRFPLKTVHPFRNFLAVLPLPTLYKVETRKKIVQHCLWAEGRAGLDLCELENAPERQKCPKTFVHDLLGATSFIWDRQKRSRLRVICACRPYAYGPAGCEGGCRPSNFGAIHIFWAARENLGKASF